jgi:hypothetical protein
MPQGEGHLMRSGIRHALITPTAMLAAFALVGCGSGESESKGPAQGNQVLEGSISDDMIAYDTLRSEPPPAQIIATDGEEGSVGSGSGAANPVPAVAGDASSPTPSPDAAADPTPDE